MAPEPGRWFPLRARGTVILAMVVAAGWAYGALGLSVGGLLPDESGWTLASEFFGRMLSPATEHETAFVPETSLWASSLAAAGRTIGYAAAAMGLSLALGVVLGFLGSSAWWSGEVLGRRQTTWRSLARGVAPILYGATRLVIALMRSVHELLWALLFLVIFGLTPTTAVVAIAIPYGGTLAKIFSELVDEAPRAPALALRHAGATGLQVFVVGLLPPALPDMIAYSFYRFECALRSAAILGFLGVPTLGVLIKQAFDYGEYGEAWTHLYMLIALIAGFDLWSGAVRKRMSA